MRHRNELKRKEERGKREGEKRKRTHGMKKAKRKHTTVASVISQLQWFMSGVAKNVCYFVRREKFWGKKEKEGERESKVKLTRDKKGESVTFKLAWSRWGVLWRTLNQKVAIESNCAIFWRPFFSPRKQSISDRPKKLNQACKSQFGPVQHSMKENVASNKICSHEHRRQTARISLSLSLSLSLSPWKEANKLRRAKAEMLFMRALRPVNSDNPTAMRV